MGTDDVALRFLACPQEPAPAGILDALISTRVRYTLDDCLERCSQIFESPGFEGLSHVLRNGSARLNKRSAWHLLQGRLFRALRLSNTADIVAAAAGVASLFASAGEEGLWRCRLSTPSRLLFGPWLLPPATEIATLSAGGVVTFTLRSERAEPRTLIFRSDGSAWTSDQTLDKFTLAANSILLMSEDGLLPDERPSGVTDSEWRADSTAATMLATAITLLGDRAHPYAGWVRDALSHLILLGGSTKELRSGSASDQYGLSFMSLPENPIALAENLVHESSHQYFAMSEWVDAVDDGTDETLYYSPAVKRGRPLSAILLAYHAFANVLLTYRSMLDSGFDIDGYAAYNNAWLSKEVADLAKPLDGNAALTDVGLSLYEPLRDRIAAGG
jgi:HEXXH motif-containing protein